MQRPRPSFLGDKLVGACSCPGAECDPDKQHSHAKSDEPAVVCHDREHDASATEHKGREAHLEFRADDDRLVVRVAGQDLSVVRVRGA